MFRKQTASNQIYMLNDVRSNIHVVVKRHALNNWEHIFALSINNANYDIRIKNNTTIDYDVYVALESITTNNDEYTLKPIFYDLDKLMEVFEVSSEKIKRIARPLMSGVYAIYDYRSPFDVESVVNNKVAEYAKIRSIIKLMSDI